MSVRAERLVAALVQRGVTRLVDVRLNPSASDVKPGRYGPKPWTLQPGRSGIVGLLEAAGIAYEWLVELGNPQRHDPMMAVLRAHLADPAGRMARASRTRPAGRAGRTTRRAGRLALRLRRRPDMPSDGHRARAGRALLRRPADHPRRSARSGQRSGATTLTASSDDLIDDAAMHVGQAAVDAIVPDREPGMVDAEQVQDRGVDVVALVGDFRSAGL